MNKNLPQWKKRLDIVNIIYRDILTNHNSDKLKNKEYAFDSEEFTYNQLKIIENYFQNYDSYKQKIIVLLDESWSWERVNPYTKALIMCAIAEHNAINTKKAIIIDQALKTCDHRGLIKDKKFINAILEKMLKIK